MSSTTGGNSLNARKHVRRPGVLDTDVGRAIHVSGPRLANTSEFNHD